ncbi:hypothetical protein, partial [Mesotoga sp.]|uniref:hypothetical protein n=1 Tax=Mesotoga sp. TaxID=2053577 RepID=UPI00345E6FC9
IRTTMRIVHFEFLEAEASATAQTTCGLNLVFTITHWQQLKILVFGFVGLYFEHTKVLGM